MKIAEAQSGDDRTLLFQVAIEMVDDLREWSDPVQLRFEEHDGRLELWMQTVEPKP